MQPRFKRKHRSSKARPLKAGPWHLTTTPLAERNPETLTHNERRRLRRLRQKARNNG